jgi:hypothetical protein
MTPHKQLVTLKNGDFWDVMPRFSCKNRRFGGGYRLNHRSDKDWRAWNTVAFLRRVIRLLVTANVVPSSLILVTQMMEEIRSSETSVLTRATRHHIP